MSINTKPSLNELLEISKATLDELQAGEEFIVKELFRGFEWNRIPKGDRTKLDSMFFSFANNEGNGIIVGIGKPPQNQQKYRKL